MPKAVFWVLAVLGPAVPPACAGYLYQSATLGPTGVTTQELLNQDVPGLNIFRDLVSGARFFLDRPSHITGVGGHFVTRGEDTPNPYLYAAVVSLDGQDDFPDSPQLDTDDVLSVALIETPEVSGDVYGDMSLHVPPGWYAVVYGTNRFGAEGSGMAVRNGVSEDFPFIRLSPSAEWVVHFPFLDNMRFVVRGIAVPEPTTLVATSVAILALSANVRLRNRVG